MITRDNYEEFFLLYVDNELSAADRLLVERFVTENPDISEELEALLQCRIGPDQEEQAVFGNKESLMRFTSSTEVPTPDHADHETLFLSYIDGELDEKDRHSVEELIRDQPSKRLELERLRQTISQPDLRITFLHKESLYREVSDRKIIAFRFASSPWLGSFPWWRIAAAAIVLIVAGILLFRPFNSGTHSLTGGKGTLAAIKKDTPAVTPATATTLYSSEARKQTAAGPVVKPKEHRPFDQPQNAVVQARPFEEDPAQTGRPEEGTQKIAAIERKGTDGKAVGPLPVREKITRLESNAIAAADPRDIVSPGRSTIAPERSLASNEETISKENSSFATQALLNDSTDPIEDDPGSDPASTKKNKLRGLFRKVSRTFGKTADRDDDGQRKVLIGAFQFALK